jgi:predicted TIM-barrel fold metal-dependent hydrolase
VTVNGAGRPYVLISSDAHAGADLWDYKPYLARGFHSEFDAWASSYQEDSWGKFDTEMMDTDDPNVRLGVSSFGSIYNWDSEKRLAHMDQDGVAAEVIFPNTVPPFYPRGIISAAAPSTAEEYRLRWAGIQAHNRWLVDFCALAPGRRAGLAQVFLTDLDDAIAEVRWAREAGLMGVLIPADHTLKLVNLYERRLDPFWAACCEVNLPVNRHTLFVGPPETDESGPATDAVSMYENLGFFKRGLGQLMLGGVFQRFPDMKVIFTETATTWFAPELQALDGACRGALVKGTARYPLMHRAVEGLDRWPSEYFQRNCWIGASLMTRADVEGRHQVGVDHLIWGSDYPHHEGSWPRTRLALRLQFSDVPEDEVRTMTSRNAAKVYGFDLEFLQALADRIGPTPYEVATPVAAGELPDYSMCPAISEAIEPLNRLVAEARIGAGAG